MEEEVLTKDELAKYLKITVRMVDKLRTEGMPSFKVGKLIRFKKDEVMEWLENHQQRTEK